MRSLIILAVYTALAAAIPSNIQIRPISRTSVSISWQQAYDPQLKGFTIHYHNGDSHSTEWLAKTIWDPRASETTIDGLRSEGEYSFCVRSLMTGSVCPCSHLVHINIATGVVTSDAHVDEHGGHQQLQQGGYHQQQQGGYHQQQQGGYQHPQQGGFHHQQQQQGGHASEVGFLEAGAIGNDYVQLRWRYDGPKPAKYLVTYRGSHRSESADGRWEEEEVDVGDPAEVDVEHYVAQGLSPDTTYTFEVFVVDPASGRPISRPQSTRVTTKAYIV